MDDLSICKWANFRGLTLCAYPARLLFLASRDYRRKIGFYRQVGDSLCCFCIRHRRSCSLPARCGSYESNQRHWRALSAYRYQNRKPCRRAAGRWLCQKRQYRFVGKQAHRYCRMRQSLLLLFVCYDEYICASCLCPLLDMAHSTLPRAGFARS
ncbi:Uncharacterised protein [Neisseria gonorrhoeae]|nr:Uncharacterised protein [Neisseria gonorrhoeae]